MQGALLRACANISLFQPGTNMYAWLYTILRNQFYTRMPSVDVDHDSSRSTRDHGVENGVLLEKVRGRRSTAFGRELGSRPIDACEVLVTLEIVAGRSGYTPICNAVAARCSLRLLLEGTRAWTKMCVPPVVGSRDWNDGGYVINHRPADPKCSPARSSARAMCEWRRSRHPIRCDAADFHRKCARCTGSELEVTKNLASCPPGVASSTASPSEARRSFQDQLQAGANRLRGVQRVLR